MSDLVGEIEAAEQRRDHLGTGSGCKACDAIAAAEPGAAREALTRALAGTIGERRLVDILRRNGIQVGRTVIGRHRQEGHR